MKHRTRGILWGFRTYRFHPGQLFVLEWKRLGGYPSCVGLTLRERKIKRKQLNPMAAHRKKSRWIGCCKRVQEHIRLMDEGDLRKPYFSTFARLKKEYMRRATERLAGP